MMHPPDEMQIEQVKKMTSETAKKLLRYVNCPPSIETVESLLVEFGDADDPVQSAIFLLSMIFISHNHGRFVAELRERAKES